MKDTKWVIIFIAVGLVLAYFVGAPLRKNPSTEPLIGTPLDDAKLYAEGTIVVSNGVQQVLSKYPALFIIARAAGSQGAPLAVRRITTLEFPLEFKLTERDSMAGGEFYDGDLDVIARLDADGAGGAAHPDDLLAKATIKKGGSRTIQLEIGL